MVRLRTLGYVFVSFVLGVGGCLAFFATCGRPSALVVRFDETPGAGAGVRVYVSGAVREPGVYPLRAGDRVVEAVEAAGGPSEDADTEAVNFAEKIQDGEHLRVPRVGDPAGPASAAPSSTSGAGVQRVDINRADVNLLRSLPGISSTRAQSIVTSRQSAGQFRSTEELVTRKLVTESIYAQMKDLIDVGH